MEKMDVTKIHPFTKVVPMIYAYNTPGISYHDGWTKIGYTERQSVKDRINQQTHTANIKWELCWQDNAIYKDGSGEPFDDHDFHRYLTKEKGVEREPKTEWFRIDGDTSQLYFMKFAQNKYDIDIDGAEYILREPQEKAVEKTMKYFSQGGKEFLWNAKPRFGKTLTAYDLILRMNFKNVLIVTNRPSIGNSWADDFRKFIAHKGKLCFVSDTDSLKDVAGVMSRDEYMRKMEDPDDENWLGMVAFISLQDLKGSDNFGGKHRKLDWINEKHFDLIIVDESHEAADTYRSEIAFRHINYDHMLCLSGTPFKALAGGRYSENQIFNWSYADEQEAKKNWTGAGKNPYEDLPRLALFTYQLSDMIFDEVQRGVNLSDDETYDYAFDLNEFFSTNESGNFVHEDEVLKFIKVLKTQEKYPFSTPELRNELKHTLWILNRVDSVNALARILRKDDVFGEAKGEYKIVIAAGDRKANESEDDANKSSLEKVRAAIAQNDKTITLSVGQLTVGVTVPEWSGVLMLQNMTSPSSYMQAAFRAQNPYATRNSDGQIIKKDTAYVFDFDPSRTLIIYDQFANNLSANRGSTTEERRANIERLINFFPVIGEDSEGKMVELDAEKVLTIPAKIKSTEVVRRGFISNLLFQNISNVFRAPSAVREIIEKLNLAYEEKPRKDQSLDGISDVPVGEDGNVEISNEIVIGTAQKLFGEKYYETVEVPLPEISEIDDEDKAKKVLDSYVSAVKDNIKENFIAPVIEEYDLTKRNVKSLEKEVSDRIDRKYEDVKSDYDISVTQAKNDYHSTLNDDTATDEEKSVAKDKFNEALNAANAKLFSDIQAVTQEISVEQPQSIVKKVEEFKAEEEKKGYEDKIKDHLRGFSRTIPSFIMAYGDENLTLANFDSYVSDDVFKDVTGITIDEFRFLRDGGDLTNDDGEIEHFEGQLFDETVFNSSVKEFLNKRKSLANYFDENQTEDIFCYIPPQRTNQIFTPKKVVKDMVDKLEAENPGCFDDPDATFADLYMKSGMYITEIVTRLYQSKRMKALYPDDAERLNHIFAKQVYGCAPTEIIYRICLRYILGFSDEINIEKNNIRLCDTLEYAKNGTMEEEMRKVFEL